MTRDELEQLRSYLAETELSLDDIRYLSALQWTQDEIPEIQSKAQYDEFGKRLSEVDKRLRDAGIKPGMREFARSPDGILATAIGARIIEWEENDAAQGMGEAQGCG